MEHETMASDDDERCVNMAFQAGACSVTFVDSLIVHGETPNLPTEYRESIKTLVADVTRQDVAVQIERHVKRFHIKDVDKLIERLRSHKPMTNKVLLLTHLKSEFFAGTTLIKADRTLDEDKYQGKVGLVIAMGPLACQDDDRTTFGGVKFKVGDYVVYRQSDGLRLAIDNAHCRLIEDNLIFDITTDPESVDLIY